MYEIDEARRRCKGPRTLIILLALLILAAYFMPIAGTTQDKSAELGSLNQVIAPNSGLRISDLSSMSMAKFMRLYRDDPEVAGAGPDEAAFLYWFMLAPAILAGVILLLALGTKPLLIFLINVLLGGALFFDLSWIGTMNLMNYYDLSWSAAYYILIGGCGLIELLSIVLMSRKHKLKKAIKAERKAMNGGNNQ